MAQTVQQRIQSLINQDNDGANVIHGYYQTALEEIKAHLNDFYLRYASATGLTVNDVQQSVSQWDVMQFKRAIQLLDDETKSADPSTKARVRPAVKKAKIDGASNSRKLLLTGLITLSILKATVKTDTYLRWRLNKDVKDEIKFHGLTWLQQQSVMGAVKDYTSSLSDSVWLANDSLNAQLNYLVNKNLAGKGITRDDLSRLFPYLKPKGIKPGTVTSAIHSAEYKATQAIKWWSNREIDDITMEVFKQHHVTEIDIVNEPGACPICVGIASNNPYSIDDCPSIPIHNNCRCHKKARTFSK